MSDIGAITYGSVVASTPSNTAADPNGPFDAIEATTAAGTASVVTPNGSTATVYLVLGVPKALAVARINVAGTTATGIVGYRGAVGSVA